jgi:two-component system, cell cycle sensor histidine kinase and response regulator CckA
MQTKPNLSPTAAGLRRRAEARLREQHPEGGPARTDADTQRLVHELQVHQIELEMQNNELEHARDEVEAELEKYSDLYDFAPVGYLTLDREGAIREANLAAASLLGLERARLLKRQLGLLVSPDSLPEFEGFLKKVFASKTRAFCEITLRKEGNHPVEVRLEAAVAASGRECRVAVMDLTERKRAEADRLVLSKLESTGILAGGIAHDFNNLLTTILLNLDLAQTLLPPGQDLARRLEEAKQSAVLARGLSQQLITFAKGGAPLRRLTSLSGVIRDSVRPALSGCRVGCRFFLAEDLWPAEVDAGQIGQVIRNMVLNAREATPPGGMVSIRAENVVLESQEIPALPPGQYVRVSIADRGGGIAKEVLPKIFDPYFTTKQRGDQQGLGLGLTICHTVIHKHGGAITVESEVGVGTTFHIHLPASRKRLGEEKSLLPPELARPGKILVMDDEPGLRRVIGLLLERMGHAVELVEDGERAIEVYGQAKGQGRPFDVVILDLTNRSGVGGLEAIQALLTMDPGVKAIVMSGYAADPVVVEPERYGFKGVLTKPFDSDKLQETLSSVMGGPQEAAHLPGDPDPRSGAIGGVAIGRLESRPSDRSLVER